MVHTLLAALENVPSFLGTLFTGDQKLYAVIALVVFIIALFVSNKFGKIMRYLYIIFCCVLGTVSYLRSQYTLMMTLVTSLVILAIVRLIIYLVVTVRQNRINAKIEAKALAKARKRRGSWKNKQGYSGDVRPIIDPDAPQPVPISYAERVAIDEAAARAREQAEGAVEEAEDAGYADRRQVMDAISKLKDLKDAGVLTEEEFNEKKQELYSRLG